MEDVYSHGFNPQDLMLQVHKWCQGRRTVWMYCHNLTFDLLTSDLLPQLAGMGWGITDFAVDSGAPFARLSRGDSHLTLSDSFSWMPHSINDIGQAVSIPKPALPDNDDSDEAWLIRCRGDVEILSEAMLTLMEWWDANELGRWNITGAASGWNAMRHIPSTDRILIRPDEAECDADRLAIYSGRRFCWQTGELKRGRYVELDIEKAYTTAARDLPLPVQRMGKFESLPLDHRWLDCERQGVIARVLIETNSPRYPCRHDGRVWYPVGRFWTTLAGPDIRAARDRGELRQVGAGWVHELGYALRPWASWCIASAQPDSAGTPEVARMVLRAWGRSAIGKWAQRGFERVRLGASPVPTWGHIEAWDHSEGVRASIVDFGGTRWQVSATGAADNAYPAIFAFVESYVRVALGNAIEVIGEKHVISCNTDGMIVDALAVLRSRRAAIQARTPLEGADDPLGAVIQAASARITPFALRDKTTYRRVTVWGPQHRVTDSVQYLSGIPASAQLNAEGKYQAWLWPKLAWQIRNGRQGAYVRPSMEYKLAATYAPGWVLSDGSVRPVQMSGTSDGANHLLPWAWTYLRPADAELAPDQSKALMRYAA